MFGLEAAGGGGCVLAGIEGTELGGGVRCRSAVREYSAVQGRSFL